MDQLFSWRNFHFFLDLFLPFIQAYNVLSRETRRFCNGSSHTREERRQKIRSELEVTSNCTIVYRENVQGVRMNRIEGDGNNKDPSSTTVPAFLIAIFVLVALVAVACVLLLKTKRQKMLKRHLSKTKSLEKGMLSFFFRNIKYSTLCPPKILQIMGKFMI